tara:strand:- start:55 stop:582 length:528 start_codon:yes stop_codon:yes gene_type:complete
MEGKKRARAGADDGRDNVLPAKHSSEKRLCGNRKKDCSIELYFGYPATVPPQDASSYRRCNSEDMVAHTRDGDRNLFRLVESSAGSSSSCSPDSGDTLLTPMSFTASTEVHSYAKAKDKANRWHEFRMRTIPEFSLDEQGMRIGSPQNRSAPDLLSTPSPIKCKDDGDIEMDDAD